MHLGYIGESPTSECEKIKGQCRFMLNTLENIKKADLIPQVDGSTIVSLVDDRDIWCCKQDLKEDKYLLLHEVGCKMIVNRFINAEEVGCKMIVDRKMHDKFVGSA